MHMNPSRRNVSTVSSVRDDRSGADLAHRDNLCRDRPLPPATTPFDPSSVRAGIFPAWPPTMLTVLTQTMPFDCGLRSCQAARVKAAGMDAPQPGG